MNKLKKILLPLTISACVGLFGFGTYAYNSNLGNFKNHSSISLARKRYKSYKPFLSKRYYNANPANKTDFYKMKTWFNAHFISLHPGDTAYDYRSLYSGYKHIRNKYHTKENIWTYGCNVILNDTQSPNHPPKGHIRNFANLGKTTPLDTIDPHNMKSNRLDITWGQSSRHTNGADIVATSNTKNDHSLKWTNNWKEEHISGKAVPGYNEGSDGNAVSAFSKNDYDPDVKRITKQAGLRPGHGEGSPYTHHVHDVEGYQYNNHISDYHAYLDYSYLQCDAGPHGASEPTDHVIFTGENPSGKYIIIKYPNGARYRTSSGKMEEVTPVVTLSNFQYYHPWYGSRNIDISKNFYRGIKYNGFVNMKVTYRFYHDNQPITDLSNSYIVFRHLDGLVGYHDPHSTGYAWWNNEKFVQSMWKKGYEMPDSLQFSKNPTGDYSRWSSNYDETDPTGGSMQYADNNQWTLGEYTIADKEDPHPDTETYPSEIFQPSKQATGGIYDSKPNSGETTVLFKFSGGQSSKNAKNENDTNANGTAPNPDFIAGSGVGYGNIRPRTNIGTTPQPKYLCKKYIYKLPDNAKSKPSPYQLIKYVNIVIDKNGKNSKEIPLSDFVGSSATHKVNQTMFKKTTVNGETNGNGGNYSRLTELVGPKGHQYREFKGIPQAVKWASSINCLIVKPPKPKPCKKGTKQCPVPDIYKNILKHGPDGSIYKPDHKIEYLKDQNYYNGAILAHPYQSFDYKISGKLPLLDNDDQIYSTSYDKKTKKYNYYNYRHSNNDSFTLSDVIPSEVKLLREPYMLIDGVYKIYPDQGWSHSMHFTLNKDDLESVQNGNDTQPTYRIIIPVEAAMENSNTDPNTNKQFDASQDGYGLPDVNSSSAWEANDHWLQFRNRASYESHVYTGDDQNPNDQYSHNKSTVVTEIKKIMATIYDYNYNHKYLPERDQPYGLEKNSKCANGFNDTNSLQYKDYRYHTRHAKANRIVAPLHYYGYVNSDFAVRSLQKDQGGTEGNEWRYRLAYPSLSAKNALQAPSGNDSVWSIDNNHYLSSKSTINKEWHHGQDPNYMADNDNDKNALGMRFNPDGCSDAYTSSGFTQTNYVPYIVPHISFIPDIPGEKTLSPTAKLNRDGQLIIDTDTAKHGLPFRFNMRARNELYGVHFWNDFTDDKGYPDQVTMHITDGKGHQLYEATRNVAGNKSNALANRGHYHVKLDEWPRGNNSWNGYKESTAFGSGYSPNYDLNIKNLGFHKGDKVPVHIYFTVSGLAKVDTQPLNSHGYDAAKPKVRQSSFGHKHQIINGHDSDSKDSDGKYSDNNNPNKATYIEPERTIKYFGEDPTDYNNDVRELDEEFNVTQPRNAYGKTGYGMTANDLGVSYAGHLDENQYVTKGTNMTYAFPSPFQAQDTHMNYSSDNRHKKNLNAWLYRANNRPDKETSYQRLADALLHVDPNSDSHGVLSNNAKEGIDTGLPSDLDQQNGTKNYDDSDDYYGQFLNDEDLTSGKFSTTYGFYPREATHNTHNSKITYGGSNGGDINIAPSQGRESKDYNDKPVNTNKSIHNLLGHRSYGINGVITKNDEPISASFKKAIEKVVHPTSDPYEDSSNNEDITNSDQDERMFTPIFMKLGRYSTNFHRSYSPSSRKHRLGGNFFDIDENRPVKFYGHIYISKNSRSKKNDEFSLQPILSNTKNGLNQTPASAPLFPTNWLSSADKSMAPNWYDAKIFGKSHKSHKHHGHKIWFINIGQHSSELKKKY